MHFNAVLPRALHSTANTIHDPKWRVFADADRPAAHVLTFAQRCPQSWFNPILHRYAGRFKDVQFLWRHRLLGLRQDSEGVAVDVQSVHVDAARTIRCRYLVGCDGARSVVREQIGVEYMSSDIYGHSAEAIVESREIADLARPRMGGRYTALTDNGISVTLLPYDGVDRFRIVLVSEPDKVDQARMASALLQVVGRKVAYSYLTPVLPWVNRERVAEKFRVGRVFLAGASAHTMPPAGGHGMNTGVLDGFDLGWKLAGVLQGWAVDALLDSYQFDRRKGAARTAAMAGELYMDWGKVKPCIGEYLPYLTKESVQGADARRRVGELIGTTFAREYNALGVSIGYRYSGSLVLVDDGTPEPAVEIVQLVQTARPGHRMPHAWLTDGRSTLDLVDDVYTLIEIGGDPVSRALTAVAAEKGIPLVVHRIYQSGLAELFDASAILVRPDQHVAWRAKGALRDPAEVLDILTGRGGSALDFVTVPAGQRLQRGRRRNVRGEYMSGVETSLVGTFITSRACIPYLHKSSCAACAILCRSSRSHTGNFAPDDDVLAEEGMGGVDRCWNDPGSALRPDLVVDPLAPLPPGSSHAVAA